MSWWREQARSVAVQMSRAHSPATPHGSAVDRHVNNPYLYLFIFLRNRKFGENNVIKKYVVKIRFLFY